MLLRRTARMYGGRHNVSRHRLAATPCSRAPPRARCCQGRGLYRAAPRNPHTGLGVRRNQAAHPRKNGCLLQRVARGRQCYSSPCGCRGYRSSRDTTGAPLHYVGAGWVLAASRKRGAGEEDNIPGVVEAPSEADAFSELHSRRAAGALKQGSRLSGLPGWAAVLLAHVLSCSAVGAAYKHPSAFWAQFGDKETYVAPAELSTLLFALAALTPIMQNADLTAFCCI